MARRNINYKKQLPSGIVSAEPPVAQDKPVIEPDGSILEFGGSRSWDISKLDVSEDERAILQAGLDRAIKDSQSQGINTDGVRVTFRLVGPGSVDKQFGAGGEAIKDRVRLDVDRSRIFDSNFSDAVARFGTHELNHLERTQRGQIPVRTLGEALVSEGLAQLAEATAGHEAGAYSKFKSSDDMKFFAGQAKDHLDEVVTGTDNPGYGQWFYGASRGEEAPLPMHGGYALGVVLVRAYCKAHKLSPVDALHVPAKTMIDEWKEEKLDLDTSLQNASVSSTHSLRQQAQPRSQGPRPK